MANNGYHQYKEQAVMTMTQGELVIVLYDELIKRLRQAQLCLEVDNYALFDTSIQRSIDIVRYFNTTLDHDYEISRNLRQMYEYFLFELARAKAGRRKEVLYELQPMVKELRETFAQAGKNA